MDPAKAGLAGDPGSYNELNGALTQFDNAYNVELYSLANGGALDANSGDYIENNALNHALTLGTTTDAFDYLYNYAMGDLISSLHNDPPEDHSGGFVFAGRGRPGTRSDRDCAAAPVPGYPGSA